MKLDNFSADVQKFVNLFDACLNNKISKDEVRAELSKESEEFNNKIFWALYNVRNAYDTFRSGDGYCYYDKLLDIYKDCSPYYERC